MCGSGSSLRWVRAVWDVGERGPDPPRRGSRRLQALIGSTEWVAGHKAGIPAYERVIRIPFRMVQILREACAAAEHASAVRGVVMRRAAFETVWERGFPYEKYTV